MTNLTETAVFSLGVFLSNSHKNVLKRKAVNHKRYGFLALLAEEAAKAGDTLFFFCPEDVRKKENLITEGLYYDLKTGDWLTAEFPVPAVIYERIYLKTDEVEQIRRYFRKKQVKSINSQISFDKCDTHRKLSRCKSAAGYLPPAIDVNNFNDVRRFLLRYNTVYLKKGMSSLGKGVLKVARVSPNRYEYSHFRSRLRTRAVADIEKLRTPIHNFFKNNKYIAQKGIDLLTLDESSIDFRAEVQRSGPDITIPAVSARVGIKRSPITVHSVAMPAEEFFRTELDYSEEQIQEKMKEIHVFLHTIYMALEKSYGALGEIGIDFGIDRDGELWFIEANSKSAKVSLEKSYGIAGLRKNAENILSYARYLTGIQKKDADLPPSDAEQQAPPL
ncbi:YheC/YheD family protein [Alteribacter natronophilus]|uniref:YheC/YheD family protein n=1 Tax=Alteribacter natronophilus TaxID=2583810 RepID=UPI00110EB6CA|nr:YheC/YheD family protein [Alteribacter natronophilus]TMW71831.1 YheC/YheD family protein [Alteribacter natronophilus]